jgi:class 3 adenylate cyclase
MEKQHPILLEFEDAELERAYADELFELHQRRQARVVFAVVILYAIVLPLLDWFVIPDVFGVALRLRMLVLLPTQAALYSLAFTRHYRRLFMTLLVVPMLLGWVVFYYLGAIAKPPGSYLYVLWPALFMLGMPLTFKLTVRRALVANLAVFVLYIAMEVMVIKHPLPVLVFTVAAYISATGTGVFFGRVADESMRALFIQKRHLDAERARAEALLLNILPEPIAERLKAQPGAIADGHAEATVLFSDIVGFTPLSERLTPSELVDLLNGLFTRFDDLAEQHGLEKIKTIGDAYMVAGGVPFDRGDHTGAVVAMALDMQREVAQLARARAVPLDVRIGIHTGPVVAGVIGKKKFSYDLWGDTVNTAARMESHGVPGAIQVSDAVRERLGERFRFDPRGEIEIKGKGKMRTWLLSVA